MSMIATSNSMAVNDSQDPEMQPKAPARPEFAHDGLKGKTTVSQYIFVPEQNIR
jgi:hypothetical protein